MALTICGCGSSGTEPSEFGSCGGYSGSKTGVIGRSSVTVPSQSVDSNGL